MRKRIDEHANDNEPMRGADANAGAARSSTRRRGPPSPRRAPRVSSELLAQSILSTMLLFLLVSAIVAPRRITLLHGDEFTAATKPVPDTAVDVFEPEYMQTFHVEFAHVPDIVSDARRKRDELPPELADLVEQGVLPEAPAEFKVKVVALYAAKNLDPATEVDVRPIWINPQCCGGGLCTPDDADMCDASTGTQVVDQVDFGNAKHQSNYQNTKQLPGSSYVDMAPRASLDTDKALSIQSYLTPQSRLVNAVEGYPLLRLEFCKQNPGNANNARVKFKGSTSNFDFVSPACMVSFPIKPVTRMKIEANARIIVKLAYDISASVWPNLPAVSSLDNAHCDTEKCFLFPVFKPIVWAAGDEFTIGTTICEDLDLSGTCDAGEPGIPNAVVKLRDKATAALVSESASGSNGVVTFRQFSAQLLSYLQGMTNKHLWALAPDTVVALIAEREYVVEASLPSSGDYTKTTHQPMGRIEKVMGADVINWFDFTTEDGGTTIEFETDGTSKDDLAIGFVRQITLGHYIWHDADRNGRRDTADAPLVGVFIELFDDFGVIANTTTDAAGKFTFTSFQQQLLPASQYKIVIQPNQTALNNINSGQPMTVTDREVTGNPRSMEDSRGVYVKTNEEQTIEVAFALPMPYPAPEDDTVPDVILNVGIVGFDCSALFDCSGHGVCVEDLDCDCQIGWEGQFCDEDSSITLPPTPPPPPLTLPPSNPFPPGQPGSPCGFGGRFVLDQCGVCGGMNDSCDPMPMGSSFVLPSGDDLILPILAGVGALCFIFLLVVTAMVLVVRTRRKRDRQERRSDVVRAAVTPIDQYAKIPDGPMVDQFGGIKSGIGGSLAIYGTTTSTELHRGAAPSSNYGTPGVSAVYQTTNYGSATQAAGGTYAQAVYADPGQGGGGTYGATGQYASGGGQYGAHGGTVGGAHGGGGGGTIGAGYASAYGASHGHYGEAGVADSYNTSAIIGTGNYGASPQAGNSQYQYGATTSPAW